MIYQQFNNKTYRETWLRPRAPLARKINMRLATSLVLIQCSQSYEFICVKWSQWSRYFAVCYSEQFYCIILQTKDILRISKQSVFANESIRCVYPLSVITTNLLDGNNLRMLPLKSTNKMFGCVWVNWRPDLCFQ